MDKCWILEEDMLCTMNPPKFNPGVGITYSFIKDDLQKAEKLYKNRY